MLSIAFSSDHAGFALKQALISHYTSLGYTCCDLGAGSEQSVDYPDFGYKLSAYIRENPETLGVAICGSGIGICIACNRVPGVRAALCMSPEMAHLARAHNDANILCLGARLISPELGLKILDEFLETPFEGDRHIKRVEKLR